MTCEHLSALDTALAKAGFKGTFRGAAWSQNCREWVYYDCVLDLPSVRKAFKLADCVKDHQHRGTHDGQESGFACEVHHDAVMGRHPDAAGDTKRFDPA